MPTDLPKISVYLPRDVYDSVVRAADAMGVSRSALLGQLAESAVPVFDVLTDAAVALNKAPEAMRGKMLALADQLEPLQKDGESLVARALEVVRAGEPPTGNTGVTP